MRDIIIGAGEIGKAIKQFYPKAKLLDLPPHPDIKAEVLHICFPYNEGFIKQVIAYQVFYKPKATIIHSTVAVGTTSKLKDAVHSPCFGKHPKLIEQMKIYPKLIGGRNALAVGRIREKFSHIICYDDSETTELFKLLSTTHYGLQIAWAQEVERICSKWDIEFGDYLFFILGINEGLKKAGASHCFRSTCTPGKIGGHCVMANLKILSKQFKSKFFEAIGDSDGKYPQNG